MDKEPVDVVEMLSGRLRDVGNNEHADWCSSELTLGEACDCNYGLYRAAFAEILELRGQTVIHCRNLAEQWHEIANLRSLLSGMGKDAGRLRASENALRIVRGWLESVTADAVKYLVPDSGCNADWFINRVLWFIDGPHRREMDKAIAAAAADAWMTRIDEPPSAAPTSTAGSAAHE